MRLTPEIVAEAPQQLNCVGARELSLRDLAIPVVENLAVARDGFDTIDLSGNAITELGPGCFPPFPRLTALYVGSNRIRAIQNGLANSLPNLQTLVLANNAIASVGELNVAELARFKRLEVLSYIDNPVAADPSLRLVLVHQIPSLRFINFARVSRAERMEAIEKHGPPPKSEKAAEKDRSKRRKRARQSKEIDGAPPKTSRASAPTELESGAQTDPRAPVPAQKSEPQLSESQVESIKRAIQASTSIDEVLALQAAMQAGDISKVLTLISGY